MKNLTEIKHTLGGIRVFEKQAHKAGKCIRVFCPLCEIKARLLAEKEPEEVLECCDCGWLGIQNELVTGMHGIDWSEADRCPHCESANVTEQGCCD
jgi:hypothetical protein